MRYDPADHYWMVAGEKARLWSSATSGYVAADDAAYSAWRDAGGVASRIASEFELDLVLRENGLSIGRTFPADEARAALAAIDVGRLKAALGRDAIDVAEDGDAERLRSLAAVLCSSAATAPEIEGVAAAKSIEDKLAELTERIDALSGAAARTGLTETDGGVVRT